MQQKTLDEHLQFVEAAARLGFNLAYTLKKSLPDESLEQILRLRTCLYHVALRIDTLDTPLQQFTELPEAADADDFESQMWERTKSYILDQGAASYSRSWGLPFDRQKLSIPVNGEGPECFRYDPPREGSPDRCFFHIRNSMAPDSFLAHEDYVVEKLRLLMSLMERDYGVKVIGTNSWMNSKARWLRFFPQAWQDNKEARPLIPQWHLGYWGQILTARGTFNQKVGDFIRKNGKMYYVTCYCSCTMEQLRKHLDDNF